jgi:hypothetical protein
MSDKTNDGFSVAQRIFHCYGLEPVESVAKIDIGFSNALYLVNEVNRIASLPADHPVQVVAGERVGRGVEFVLEVDDLPAIYAHVLAQQWPLSGELQRQPWGLQDFRLVDPDGYYWWITERRP